MPYLGITYIDDASGAEPSPSIKPVIILELINLYSLLLVRGRHNQRHGQSQLPSRLYWLTETGWGKVDTAVMKILFEYRMSDTNIGAIQYDEARDSRPAKPRKPERNPPPAVVTVMSTDVYNVWSCARTSGP